MAIESLPRAITKLRNYDMLLSSLSDNNRVGLDVDFFFEMQENRVQWDFMLQHCGYGHGNDVEEYEKQKNKKIHSYTTQR